MFTTPSFAPTNVPNLQLWLDAADTSSITSVVGAVSQWNDKSGNGNHATQGTGSAQPTTGLNSQNGKNVINGASGDYMLLPSALYSITNADNTIFSVARRTAETGSLARIINATEGGSSRMYLQYSATAGAVNYLNATSAAATAAGSSGNTNTNFQIIRGRLNGTLLGISVNSATPSTSNTGSYENGTDALAIFAQPTPANYLIGDIAEILIYNRSLSNAECSQIETYLGNKWNI